MNNIIILGGTFNPVHRGHVQLAVKAHEIYGFPVLVMPSGDPSSYKSGIDIVSAAHRINMLQIAIRDYDYMSVSTIEVERTGRTYTADTLRIMKNQYDEIYFIIGADSFFALDLWYHPEYICKNCHLLVAGRDNHTEEEMLAQKEKLEKDFGAKIEFLHTPNMAYSSTEIRDLVKHGEDVSQFVPSGVNQYIRENHLYLK